MNRCLLALACATLPAAADGVGLGPLTLDAAIDGTRQGFALTLLNPYAAAATFEARAIGDADERAQDRVSIFPAEAELGAGRSRRLLVVVDGLAVGETYRFRVCAARRQAPAESLIHARVCSRLTARRVL